MTNREKLTQMTNDELAAFMSRLIKNNCYLPGTFVVCLDTVKAGFNPTVDCCHCLNEWLNEEAKEEVSTE